ncbi:hypothetical protein HKCCA1058_11705 [Rhodobacterales bacterium HKCCA1058]|nr:hypothetical protein [Rhodobacterales bacterium HKCCA1058]
MKSRSQVTATQALVSSLTAQLTEDDVPFIAGEWSMFSHGIVTGLGEARFKRSGTKSPFVFVIDTDPYPSTEPRGTWWDVGVPEGSEQAQVKAAYASYVENRKSQ